MKNHQFHDFLLELSGEHRYSIDRHNPQTDYCREKQTLLIKNQEQESDIKYIGGVMICEKDDLHAYMLQEYRGQGIMKKFMETIVIPYLYNVWNLTKIKVTGMSTEGEALLKSLGFEKTSGKWWVLEK